MYFGIYITYQSVSSVTQACPTLCDPMNCSMPGFPVHHQLLEPAQIHVHWVNNAIQLSHLLLSPSPPAFNVSHHQNLLQWVSSIIRWPKYWSFSFILSPSNAYSGFISSRIDWFDLLAVQGTLKESSPTPQFKGINSSVLSFLYGPTLTFILNAMDWMFVLLSSSYFKALNLSGSIF